MTSNQNIEQVISRAVTFATTGLICYTSTASCYPSRNVVAYTLRYLKLHREQQKRERDFAARSILRAQEDIDESTRQPNRAHILMDAWTERNWDTPKMLLDRNGQQYWLFAPVTTSKRGQCSILTSFLTLIMPPIQPIVHSCSPPCEDSVGDSTPPLQTIVQFAKLPHDSLNEDWHLGITAYECLCRSFAFTEIP